MSNSPLILGTRGSDLALTQANMTRDALLQQDFACEIKVIKTIGDKRPDLKLSEFSEKEDGIHDKGIFTKELEEALLAKGIDFAVHSLKDVPTELGDPFEICTTLERAPIADVMLSTVPCTLPEGTGYTADNPLAGKTVATSSVRRAAQLKWVFPGVQIEDIRGNVPTRIRKLIENPDWHAIVLARAGIQRLGIYDPANPAINFEGTGIFTYELPLSVFHPAASQGAVAMEVLKENQRAKEALAHINHAPTFAQITAERSFLAALKAGCQTPVGITSRFSDDSKTIHLDTVVFCEEDLDAAPKTAKLSIPVEDATAAGELLLAELS